MQNPTKYLWKSFVRARGGSSQGGQKSLKGLEFELRAGFVRPHGFKLVLSTGQAMEHRFGAFSRADLHRPSNPASALVPSVQPPIRHLRFLPKQCYILQHEHYR